MNQKGLGQKMKGMEILQGEIEDVTKMFGFLTSSAKLVEIVSFLILLLLLSFS